MGVWEAFKIFRLFSNYFFAAVSILRATIEAEAVTPAIPIKEAAAKVNKFFISGNPFTYYLATSVFVVGVFAISTGVMIPP